MSITSNRRYNRQLKREAQRVDAIFHRVCMGIEAVYYYADKLGEDRFNNLVEQADTHWRNRCRDLQRKLKLITPDLDAVRNTYLNQEDNKHEKMEGVVPWIIKEETKQQAEEVEDQSI